MNEPLAFKLRPNKLSDIIGQDHLVKKDKILYNLVKNKKIFSMILYGPPGIGKTSIAYAIANELDIKVRFLNAVINNKKDFDVVVEEAKMYKGVLLIMDEIHRLNKDKQDLLLPHLESGLIVLIGLTTSNPYHSINNSIRSRCQIFELKGLSESDIKLGIKKSLKSEYLEGVEIDDKSIDYIVKLSNNDLRYAYNLLEIAYYSFDKKIDINKLKSINNKKVFLSDKDESNHYDLLSAFQKSIRGSDVNASLHYLSRLIVSEDFDSIYRRMLVCAYEDIGLSNPNMGTKVLSCIESCERLGMPELIIPLSVCIIDMALSTKSNSAYLAINTALNDVYNENIDDIPSHIKISAVNYKYPHDFNGYVKQQYLPDKLINRKYYIPKINNKYETILKELYEKK